MTDREERRPRHMVVLNVTVQFDGTYYHPEEMVGVCDSWIDGGFCDRDNLSGYNIVGTVIPVSSNVRLSEFHNNLIENLVELDERDRWLSALEAAGVDNWEGVSHAREIFEERGEDET